MNINLRCKDVSLMTEDIKDFAQKKIESLKRLVDEGSTVHVDFSKESHHQNGDIFKVSIEINAHGQRFFTEESAQDFKTAINRAKEELQRQMSDVKGAIEAKHRAAAKVVRSMKETL